jgi:hypothetical protein
MTSGLPWRRPFWLWLALDVGAMAVSEHDPRYKHHMQARRVLGNGRRITDIRRRGGWYNEWEIVLPSSNSDRRILCDTDDAQRPVRQSDGMQPVCFVAAQADTGGGQAGTS